LKSLAHAGGVKGKSQISSDMAFNWGIPRMKNMTRALHNLLLAGAILLATGTGHAASVTFNGVANSVDRGGVYSGLYSLTIDAETLLALCDSRNSVVNPPLAWTADIWTFANIQAGSIGKFNSPSTPATLVKYSQAGWLYSQIATLAPNDYAGQADIQEAIWKVMIPAYNLVGAGAGAYFAAATGGTHDSFDWSGVMRVVTANPLQQGPYDIQEFLIGPVVPVPAAVWLFGSALGVMGVVRRRRADA